MDIMIILYLHQLMTVDRRFSGPNFADTAIVLNFERNESGLLAGEDRNEK